MAYEDVHGQNVNVGIQRPLIFQLQSSEVVLGAMRAEHLQNLTTHPARSERVKRTHSLYIMYRQLKQGSTKYIKFITHGSKS